MVISVPLPANTSRFRISGYHPSSLSSLETAHPAKQNHPLPTLIYASLAISSLICAIALPGLRPLGQVRAQFMICFRSGQSSFRSLLRSTKTHSVATVDRESVLEGLPALEAVLVTRVGNPAVSLHEDGGSEVDVRVCGMRPEAISLAPKIEEWISWYALHQ